MGPGPDRSLQVPVHTRLTIFCVTALTGRYHEMQLQVPLKNFITHIGISTLESVTLLDRKYSCLHSYLFVLQTRSNCHSCVSFAQREINAKYQGRVGGITFCVPLGGVYQEPIGWMYRANIAMVSSGQAMPRNVIRKTVRNKSLRILHIMKGVNLVKG